MGSFESIGELPQTFSFLKKNTTIWSCVIVGGLSPNQDFKRRAASVPSAFYADRGERRLALLKGTCAAGGRPYPGSSLLSAGPFLCCGKTQEASTCHDHIQASYREGASPMQKLFPKPWLVLMQSSPVSKPSAILACGVKTLQALSHVLSSLSGARRCQI